MTTIESNNLMASEIEAQNGSDDHFKCPDRSISLREHHYLTMEKGIPNPLAEPILNLINNNSIDRPIISSDNDILSLIERIIIQNRVIQSYPLIISRIITLKKFFKPKKSDPNVDDIKNAIGDKNKQKKLSKLGITSNLRVTASNHIDVVNNYIKAIDKFVEEDIVSHLDKNLDIRECMSKLVLSEWLFYYLTIKVLSMSKKGSKSNNKLLDSDTWLWDKLHQQVYYEIKKLLRKFDTPISKELDKTLTSGNSELYEIKSQMFKYPDLMFHSILEDNIRKRNNQSVYLREYQKDWIYKFSDAFNEYAELIIAKKKGINIQNPRKDFINIATMGSGKTTIASLALGLLTSNANKYISKNVSDEKIVLMIIVPSTEVMVSFGTQCALDFPCIFVQTDHNGISKPIWLHKWCPKFKRFRRKRVQIKTEKWAERYLPDDITLDEKFTEVLDWHNKYKDTRLEWCNGYENYKSPDVIFCDPASAKNMLENRDKYHTKFGYNFFPVFDEFVATADCNIDSRKNDMLQTSLAILSMTNLYFRVLMSASVTQDQLNKCDIFENRNCIILDAPPSTNSLTQIFADNKAAHPFIDLKDLTEEEMIKSVNSWDETALRCLTPNFILKALRYLDNFTLSYDDISSPQNYMQTMKRFINEFNLVPKSVKDNICNIELNIQVPGISPSSKQLTITSGSLVNEVYRLLKDNAITFDIISKEEDNFIKETELKIKDLNKQKGMKKENRNYNYIEWNSEDFTQEINNLEAQKKQTDNHIYSFSTPFGCVTLSGHWCSKYVYGGIKTRLNEIELAVVLSGLDLTFYNQKLDEAISDIKITPRRVIDSISSMYGRNDPKVEDVVILDSDKICGRCSAFQTFARAGRSGQYNCIVTAKIPSHLLNIFRYDMPTALGRLNTEYNKVRSAIKIQTVFRRYMLRNELSKRYISIVKIQSVMRRYLQRYTIRKLNTELREKIAKTKKKIKKPKKGNKKSKRR